VEYGARELKRTMHRHLTQPLAAMVSRNRVAPGAVVRVEMREEGSRPALRVGGRDEAPLAEFPTVLLLQSARDPLRRLEKMMDDAGWDVLAAETVREARRAASRNRPHAAVIDAILSDGSGVEFAQMLSQLIPGMPILILSDAPHPDFPTLPRPFKPQSAMAVLRNGFRPKPKAA
jgi:PleD family two-component response regulator